MSPEAAGKKIVLGITGGVGCGKSEVGRILERLGWEVLDADDVAHRAIDPGGGAHEAVVARFGREILDADGLIRRDRLARVVFQDERARADLNAMVHPVVRREVAAWIADAGRRPNLAVLVPLLFEAGMTDGWSAIVCVSADEAIVRQRLRGRGWSDDDIDRRWAAQWPLQEKERRSDYVIVNNGSLDDLEHSVRRMLGWLREREGDEA